MTDAQATPPQTARFPWWIVAGGIVLSLVYLPTLAAPFDFIDDGDLVYPVSTPTLAGQVEVWWDRVADNVRHLGPFRPTLHAHWQLQANLFQGDPLAWRGARMLWCALASGMLLWLMRELKAHPVAALIATAAAMWNPYRNEIWTSLTLAEGVAMPYALLSLIAARKASESQRPWRWDLLAMFGFFVSLGCKNIFVALLPAMIVLRWSQGISWRIAAVYSLPLIMPVAHFIYFKLNWKPGNYVMAGPSWEQASRFWLWMKGASGVDFLGAGAALVLGYLWWTRRNASQPTSETVSASTSPRPWTANAPWLSAVLLILAGFAVYLPMDMMSPRYTMPAVWGVDILFALLLTRFVTTLPETHIKCAIWVALGIGMVCTLGASVARQDKIAARSRLLWEALEYVEKTLPANDTIAWIGGDSQTGELNTEEGIHFAWHLKHRGRGDLQIGLFDTKGAVLSRVELPQLTAPPKHRITASPSDESWELARTFTQTYRLGRKRFECRLENAKPGPKEFSYLPVHPTTLPPTGQGFALDPFTAQFMKESFNNPGKESETLLKLRPKQPGINGAADLLIGSDK